MRFSIHDVAMLPLALMLYAQIAMSVPTNLWHRQPASAPDFVTKYAPLVWLESTDKYNPSDIADHVAHTKPQKEFQDVSGGPDPLTLDNLDQLNAQDGVNVFLTSVDDVTTNPSWLFGVRPDSGGKTVGAISSVIIVNDHGSGLVDVFYMYFYAFDFGGIYLGQEVGNHVGDWEHTMVRFQDGKPENIWFSQHSFGEAFIYDAVEKQGDRPVAYSANGTHANYATAGTHSHDIPGFNGEQGFLEDTCDQGSLWDPTRNAYFYSFDAQTKAFTAYDSANPVNFLNFVGRWGDESYPDSDDRQHKFLGIDSTARFADGPTGPRDKQLDRKEVCPESDSTGCRVQTKLGP